MFLIDNRSKNKGPGPVSIAKPRVPQIDRTMAAASAGQPPPREVRTFTVQGLNSPSYAGVTQVGVTPKREQGLILDSVEGLTLTDYVCAIGELVQPKDIHYASRISNNRICLYLSSKNLVNDLTDKYNTIQIAEHSIPIRPLVSKLKRIIFSNVSPSIPNYALENILDELNVKRGSSVTTLKATIHKEGFNHIASFRRQVYVKPDDVTKIPETFIINLNELNHYIYASTDVLKCFICKNEGHLAKNCKNIEDPNNTLTNINSQEMYNPPNINTDNNTANSKQIPILMDTVDQTSTENSPKVDNKRTHSQISSNSSQNELNLDNHDNEPINTKITPINKKDKKETDATTNQFHSETPPFINKIDPTGNKEDILDKKLSSIKDYLNNSGTLLNYIQFKSLLESTQKVKRPINIIKQYTNDLEAFERFLKEDVYRNVRNTSIKTRCTKLLKCLKDPNTDTTPTATPINSDTEN